MGVVKKSETCSIGLAVSLLSMSKPTSGWEEEDFNGIFSVQWITTSGDFSYFGCIASRNVAKHTLIHKERLALQGQDIWTALDRHRLGEHQSQEDDDKYLQTILTPVQREQLWRLHDQRHSPPRLIGIIYSNAFCNSDLGNEPTLFVGATSRFNHSCRPNAGMDFSGYDIRIFTTRPVLKGEELCLSYNNVVYYHSSRVRRKFLQHQCLFDCQCVVCRIKDDGSDQRRCYLGCLARQLASQGATFLFDEIFEQKVRMIAQEEDCDDDNNNVEQCSTSDQNDQRFLAQLIEYLKLLEVEGIDHDILQCLELAYDLAVVLDKNSDMNVSSDIPKGYNPTELAHLTLALYELQKGPNHTCTNTFRLKVQSQDLSLSLG